MLRVSISNNTNGPDAFNNLQDLDNIAFEAVLMGAKLKLD
jgi:hypothetical protein